MDASRRELLDLLACLGRALQGDLRLRAGSAQLLPVHLQALLYLRQANRYSNTPQALAEYLGSTKGTVSQSLLWLYRKGLVERRPDDRDRRVVRLALSPQALSLLGDGGVEGEAWTRATAAIDDRQVGWLVEVLTSLLRGVQAERGGRSFGVCRSCTHFCRDGAERLRCGITGEELSGDDSMKICREHQVAAVSRKPHPGQNSRK